MISNKHKLSYVFKKPTSCSRFFLDLLVMMLRYVCLSMHHNFTAVTAEHINTLSLHQKRAMHITHSHHRSLTSDRCRAFTVVQDGQLPKHVPRGQSSEVTAGLRNPQLPIWNRRSTNHQRNLTYGTDPLSTCIAPTV